MKHTHWIDKQNGASSNRKQCELRHFYQYETIDWPTNHIPLIHFKAKNQFKLDGARINRRVRICLTQSHFEEIQLPFWGHTEKTPHRLVTLHMPCKLTKHRFTFHMNVEYVFFCMGDALNANHTIKSLLFDGVPNYFVAHEICWNIFFVSESAFIFTSAKYSDISPIIIYCDWINVAKNCTVATLKAIKSIFLYYNTIMNDITHNLNSIRAHVIAR